MTDDIDLADVLNQTAQQRLRSLIEQIESSNARKAEEAEHCKDIYTTAKGEGFEPKAIRAIVKLRATDPAKRQELDALIDVYASAVGLV